MKRATCLTAVLLSTLVAAPVIAAPASWIGGFGGVGIPMSDLSDVGTMGLHLGATGTYMLREDIGVGAEVGWQGFGGSDDFERALSAQLGTSAEVSHSALPLLAHGMYMFPGGYNITGYGKLALGLYRVHTKLDAGAFSSDDSDIALGFAFGGGANFKVNETLAWGLQGTYHYAGTEGEPTNWVALSAMLLYGWSPP